MSQNMLDAVLQHISPAVIEKLVGNLGDESQQVSDTITAAVPAVLNGILQKSTTTAGLGSILHAAREAHDDNVLGSLIDLFAGSGNLTHKAGNFLQGLFGDHEHDVYQAVSDASGAKKSSVGAIFRMVAPILLALLGKRVADNKMDNKGFANHLLGVVPTLTALLPAALSWTKLKMKQPDELKHGLEAVHYTLSGDQGPHTVPFEANQKEKEKSGMGWLLPLLLGLATVAALWWFLGRDKGGEVKEEVVTQLPDMIPVPDSAVKGPATLPDGTALPYSKGTMEYKLLEFMADQSRPAGDDVWFDFDDVTFDFNSSTINASSDVQLQNIASIFKAYPNMKAKVGGYTDKVGDDATNLTLSQERADAILAELKKFGVADAQLLGAEGYGSKFATVPADASDEERRVDRRMSLSIRAK